jgi:phosphohistidine phosphatase
VLGEQRVEAVQGEPGLRGRQARVVDREELGVPVELQEDLYGAPGSVLLRAAAERGVDSVIVVAHDPGLSMLAGALSDGGIGHMPTCAVAIFTWDDDDWEVATAVAPQSWSLDTPD